MWSSLREVEALARQQQVLEELRTAQERERERLGRDRVEKNSACEPHT
jgi:hypothetical protein